MFMAELCESVQIDFTLLAIHLNTFYWLHVGQAVVSSDDKLIQVFYFGDRLGGSDRQGFGFGFQVFCFL